MKIDVCECGSKDFEVSDQEFKDGSIHKRMTCKACQRFLGYQKNVLDDQFKMPFGKYKGMLLKDMCKKDPEYVCWLLNVAKPSLKERLKRVASQI